MRAALARSDDRNRRQFEKIRAETRRQFEEAREETRRYFEETRRHFDMIAESLRDDFRIFADAIARHSERLDQHDAQISRLGRHAQ